MRALDEPLEVNVTDGGDVVEDNDVSRACTTGSGCETIYQHQDLSLLEKQTFE